LVRDDLPDVDDDRLHALPVPAAVKHLALVVILRDVLAFD
jgi:hypothetical protein